MTTQAIPDDPRRTRGGAKALAVLWGVLTLAIVVGEVVHRPPVGVVRWVAAVMLVPCWVALMGATVLCTLRDRPRPVGRVTTLGPVCTVLCIVLATWH